MGAGGAGGGGAAPRLRGAAGGAPRYTTRMAVWYRMAFHVPAVFHVLSHSGMVAR